MLKVVIGEQFILNGAISTNTEITSNYKCKTTNIVGIGYTRVVVEDYKFSVTAQEYAENTSGFIKKHHAAFCPKKKDILNSKTISHIRQYNRVFCKHPMNNKDKCDIYGVVNSVFLRSKGADPPEYIKSIDKWVHFLSMIYSMDIFDEKIPSIVEYLYSSRKIRNNMSTQEKEICKRIKNVNINNEDDMNILRGIVQSYAQFSNSYNFMVVKLKNNRYTAEDFVMDHIAIVLTPRYKCKPYYTNSKLNLTKFTFFGGSFKIKNNNTITELKKYIENKKMSVTDTKTTTTESAKKKDSQTPPKNNPSKDKSDEDKDETVDINNHFETIPMDIINKISEKERADLYIKGYIKNNENILKFMNNNRKLSDELIAVFSNNLIDVIDKNNKNIKGREETFKNLVKVKDMVKSKWDTKDMIQFVNSLENYKPLNDLMLKIQINHDDLKKSVSNKRKRSDQLKSVENDQKDKDHQEVIDAVFDTNKGEPNKKKRKTDNAMSQQNGKKKYMDLRQSILKKISPGGFKQTMINRRMAINKQKFDIVNAIKQMKNVKV